MPKERTRLPRWGEGSHPGPAGQTTILTYKVETFDLTDIVIIFSAFIYPIIPSPPCRRLVACSRAALAWI